jgi:hypothetical protein
LGGRGRQISEFKASVIYRVSSRTASATKRNPVSKKKKKKKKRFATSSTTKQILVSKTTHIRINSKNFKNADLEM